MKAQLIDIQERYVRLGIGDLPAVARDAAIRQAGYLSTRTSEEGLRPTPENQIRYLYQAMWVDPDLRATILDIRAMDRADPRVKKIHGRMARTAVKGGLRLLFQGAAGDKRIRSAWDRFERRNGLDRQQKLESDARGLAMEGNLPLQVVLSQAGGSSQLVSGLVRMPSETIRPLVGENGRFVDASRAYEQWDLTGSRPVATFALWQLVRVRLDPDNHDDMGAPGRPYLDASRTAWKKLTMTEEDLVIRRRHRAPLRIAHVLEGASDDDLAAYRLQVEQDSSEITTDYFSNKKAAISPIAGDANLEQVADVVHLLDTFFAGAPAPKGLFGYADGLSRDILEDMKRDYFEEIDALQDAHAEAYEQAFRLDLLLAGINPEAVPFRVRFAERRTETLNQAADRALKYQALGVSKQTVVETANLDPETEKARVEAESRGRSPYPDPGMIGPAAGGRGGKPVVSITPGNRPKGESQTAISNR